MFFAFDIFAQENNPKFELKADPLLGSHIDQVKAISSTLPLNLTYNELTESQKKVVASWYDNIPPGDEPPYPAQGLIALTKALSEVQDKLLVRGKLRLVATVDQDGNVTTVTAYGSPSPEMTKYASMVLLMTKFKAAICAGKPCTMQFPYQTEFQTR